MISEISSWLNGQNGTVQSSVLTLVGTLSAAIISCVVALLVVWVQSKSARRAVEVQERSVYLSLIERRAKWLDETLATWARWIAQQEDQIETILKNQELPSNEALALIASCRRQALWLFGPEIDDHLDRLEKAVIEYGGKRLAVREAGLMEPEERRKIDVDLRYRDFSKALQHVMKLQGDIPKKIRPYLYVGDIRSQFAVRLHSD